MSRSNQFPLLAKITNYPQHPIQMFKYILERARQKAIPMNLATADKEFGVLNRTVMYRGIVDASCICFVTERNSRKFHNLKENPKLSLTMLFALEDIKNGEGEVLPETWQVRLFDAEAVEMQNLQQLWQEEPQFAKIRSHICKCGEPTDPKEHEERYMECMKNINNGKELEQTETYTAFKIIPKRWDFYKGQPEKIADRIQYRLFENDQWEVYHVDA